MELATWHCENIYSSDPTPIFTGQDCAAETYATSSPATSTIITVGYNGPNLQEFLFVAGVLIFFISLTSWGKIFGGINK